jgi:parvulin-like peptidyl-prolyl isomerase
MQTTKILWAGVAAVIILAAAAALLMPGHKRDPEVRARSIAITADPSNPEDIARARKAAERVYELLENGADFAQLARDNSDAFNAQDGGDMGWLGRGILPERMETVIFRVEPGHYSEIIEEPGIDRYIFRIFYVEERRNF